MNTCKTCRNAKSQDHHNKPYLECLKLSEKHECGCLVYGDSIPIVVGPNFGCIHHAPKETLAR